MMKSRQEIKSLAKEGFRHQYSTGILLSVLVYVGTLGISSVLYAPGYMAMLSAALYAPNDPFAILNAVLGAGALGGLTGLISFAISLVSYVLYVNLSGAYVKLYSEEATSPVEPYTELAVNFFRKLGGYMWMILFIVLWSLLFVIPGIVKMYAYRMTPYILARHPEVAATEALELSKRMTRGNKLKLFVLDLSFIGWVILSGLTLGIVGIFWAFPYMQTTYAGFFVEIRNNSLENGVIYHNELGMDEPMNTQQPQYNDPTLPPPPPPM